MHPFTRQVQMASDAAKGGAARLAGVEAPAMPDTETTFPELKERIAKTIAFLDTITKDQVDGRHGATIELPLPGGDDDLHRAGLPDAVLVGQLPVPRDDRLRPAARARRAARQDGLPGRRPDAGRLTSERRRICRARIRGRSRRVRAAQAADEGGGQLCVYRHGEKVVDLWAGRDKVNDRPYGEDTITVIMSCTKGATAAVVHRLAERGLIDYEAPVADYWPEFAAGGKGDARVWHLMSHSVGLPGVDPESGVTAARHARTWTGTCRRWRPWRRCGRRAPPATTTRSPTARCWTAWCGA